MKLEKRIGDFITVSFNYVQWTFFYVYLTLIHIRNEFDYFLCVTFIVSTFKAMQVKFWT